MQATGDASESTLVEHVERIIFARREDVDPSRRLVVAETCAGVLRRILDDAPRIAEDKRGAMLTELKLLLSSYLAVALPRAQSGSD